MTPDVDKSRIANVITEPEKHEEIEITEEMIDAGAAILCDFYGDINDSLTRSIVVDVFVAMLSSSASGV